MASKRTSKSTRKSAAKKSPEVVMWLRLPKPMKPAELSKLGIKGDICFGGDTCIAATSMNAQADIVVQADLQESLNKAGLSRRADPCFGGDTCIV